MVRHQFLIIMATAVFVGFLLEHSIAKLNDQGFDIIGWFSLFLFSVLIFHGLFFKDMKNFNSNNFNSSKKVTLYFLVLTLN